MENLIEILKQLPADTKIYEVITGEYKNFKLDCKPGNAMPIQLIDYYTVDYYTVDGKHILNHPNAECLIFPAKDHRTWEDWQKYYGIKEQPKFHPFDKVLVRDAECSEWKATFFSHYNSESKSYPYYTCGAAYRFCIPYEGNEHLVGTSENP